MLGLVEQLREASAYDLKHAVAQSVGNFWSVPHSQIYREAERLELGGYLHCRHERTAGGRRRKIYSIVPAGERELGRWRGEAPTELPELRDPGLLKLFFGADARPLARARRDAHAQKLGDYEERRKLDPGDGPRAAWLTLDAGIAHEREWVRFWSQIATGRQP